VGIILNSKAITEAISEKDETISRLEKIMAEVQQQNKDITRQNEEMKARDQEQSRQIQELLGYAKKAEADLTTAREEMEEYREEAKEENAALQEQVETSYKQTQILSEQILEVSTKLDIAVVRRVPPELEDCKTEYFGICKNPQTNKYRVYRCQKRGRKSAIKRCASDGFTVEVYCKEDPSSVSNFNRVKKQLPPSIGVVIGFRLTLAPDATEQQLLDFIMQVDDQRRDV
jgi:seryl-tRNA synthetase